MSDTGIAHDAIAGMVATRYSGQPTQRDLDVANVAAAVERERFTGQLRKILMNNVVWPQSLADALYDLLDGDTDGQ